MWRGRSTDSACGHVRSFTLRSKILGCLFNPTGSWCKGLSSEIPLLTEIHPQLTRRRRRRNSLVIWPWIPLETHLSDWAVSDASEFPATGVEGLVPWQLSCSNAVRNHPPLWRFSQNKWARAQLSTHTHHTRTSLDLLSQSPVIYTHTHTHARAPLWIYYFPTASFYFFIILYQFHFMKFLHLFFLGTTCRWTPEKVHEFRMVLYKQLLGS